MSDIKNMTDWAKLQELLNKKQRKGISIDENALRTFLATRIKGQDEILADISRLISLQYAKESTDRPLCNLLFLGPTGTGKTELAKALAEFLFEDESNMIRFDCSEFSGNEAKARLIGVPTGYVGSEGGGQLTRPVMANPRRLILFDEIEKAYPTVFDLFLQLMGEGRLTEQGSGKTVDFTKCLIILTSNARADEITKVTKDITDYFQRLEALKSFLADAQVFKPEVMGRIDRVYIFNPLKGMVVAEIALIKIKKLAKEYGIEVDFVAPELVVKTLSENEKMSRFGIRELERIVFELFAKEMVMIRDKGINRISLTSTPEGKLICKAASDSQKRGNE